MVGYEMRSATHVFPIEVGQVVYMAPWGNLARYWGRQGDYSLITGVVTSIGRKYFYVERNGYPYRFRLDTFESAFDENSGYCLWESEDACMLFIQCLKMWEDIRDALKKHAPSDLAKLDPAFTQAVYCEFVRHGVLPPFVM